MTSFHPRKKATGTKKGKAITSSTSTQRHQPKPVKLLSGGNPQIAKADGEMAVKAYIDAMPGWKCGVGRRLDTLIGRHVAGVRKAIRWNTPFYGIEGRGWFLGFHCFTKYVKITFFRGTSLHPQPPIGSKVPNVRYVHIHESDPIDENALSHWFRQAAELDGEHLF